MIEFSNKTGYISLKEGISSLSLENQEKFSQFLTQIRFISRVMFDYATSSTLLFLRLNENIDPDGKYIDSRVTLPGFKQEYKNNQTVSGQDLGEIKEIIYFEIK